MITIIFDMVTYLNLNFDCDYIMDAWPKKDRNTESAIHAYPKTLKLTLCTGTQNYSYAARCPEVPNLVTAAPTAHTYRYSRTLQSVGVRCDRKLVYDVGPQ